MSKTNGGPSYHEWPAVEFVGRVAALVPHLSFFALFETQGSCYHFPVSPTVFRVKNFRFFFFSREELKELQGIVEERKSEIARAWKKHFER